MKTFSKLSLVVFSLNITAIASAHVQAPSTSTVTAPSTAATGASSQVVSSVTCEQTTKRSAYDLYDAKKLTLTREANGSYQADIKLTSNDPQFEKTLSLKLSTCDFSATDTYIFKCSGGSRMSPAYLWSFRQIAVGIDMDPSAGYQNLKIQGYAGSTSGFRGKGTALETDFDFAQCKVQL